MHQEEELRREEEAYYQAVRAEAAARLGRVQRRKEKLQRLIAARNDPNKWLGENDSDWEMSVYSLSVFKSTMLTKDLVFVIETKIGVN